MGILILLAWIGCKITYLAYFLSFIDTLPLMYVNILEVTIQTRHSPAVFGSRQSVLYYDNIEVAPAANIVRFLRIAYVRDYPVSYCVDGEPYICVHTSIAIPVFSKMILPRCILLTKSLISLYPICISTWCRLNTTVLENSNRKPEAIRNRDHLVPPFPAPNPRRSADRGSHRHSTTLTQRAEIIFSLAFQPEPEALRQFLQESP